MSRESFLARVRDAAAVGRSYRSETRDVPPSAGYVGAVGGDVCARLASEVKIAGGISHLVNDCTEARIVTQDVLEESRPASAACWKHWLLDRVEIERLLNDRQIQPIDHDSIASLNRQQQRDRLLAAEIGISSCDIAAAETGTLAVFARPGQERMVSLLPPIHIAIVAESQIVPDLYDLFQKLAELGFDGMPSNATLITGPSKTGDIELELTTGVHGPGQVHVVVVRNA